MEPGAEPNTPPEPEPLVIIVPSRRSSGSALFLPPILVVLLGTAFLAYRSGTNDWRGLAALLEPSPAASPRPVAPAPKPEPPKPAVDARPVVPATPVPEAPAAPEPKPAPTPVPVEKEQSLHDIEREAAQTRDRIAELEKFKEREARKLAETEGQRRDAERNQNPGRGMRFRLQPVPPEQIEKMMEAFRQRHDQLFAEQQKRMEEFEREFFKGRPGPGGMARDFAFPGPQAWPPAVPVPGPDPGRPGMNRAAPDREEKVFRTPDGGTVRYRAFQGPGGMTGYQMRWQSGGGRNAPAAPPPPRPDRAAPGDDVPPPPAPKVFD